MNVRRNTVDKKIFIVQTHKMSMAPSPPNSNKQDGRIGSCGANLEPVMLVHVGEKIRVVETYMTPNAFRKTSLSHNEVMFPMGVIELDMHVVDGVFHYGREIGVKSLSMAIVGGENIFHRQMQVLNIYEGW